MKDSKVIELLKSFSVQEMLKIRDMMNSPLFNKSEKRKSFFQYLSRFAPEFDDPRMTDENAHGDLYPSQPFKKETITKLRHELYKILQQYVLYTYYNKDNLINSIAILNYAEDKGLTQLLKGHINEIEKKQKQSKIKSGDHFYTEFLLQQTRSRIRLIEDRGRGDIFLKEVSKALDKFYILNKLVVFSHQIIRERITGYEYDYTMREELLNAIPNSPHINIPIVNLWYNTFLLVNEKDNFKYYKIVKVLVKEQAEHLSKIDIRNICGCLQNNVRGFYKDEAYFEELFYLYELQLQNGVFSYSKNSYLTQGIYYNIVKVGLTLNRIVWVETFLSDYPYQYNSEENNIYVLCKAELEFNKGNFDEVLTLLQKGNIKNIYHGLQLKRLYLRVYFELKDQYSRSFNPAIGTERTFLTRNKQNISGQQFDAHRLFVNMLSKLFNLDKNKENYEKKLQEIEEKVYQAEFIAEKKWLLQKIKLMKPNF